MFKIASKSKFKKSISFTAVAMALAFTVTMISTSAEAGKRSRYRNQAIGLGIAGAVIGSAIVNSNARNYDRRYRPRRARRLSRWERHVIRCQRAYRSYDRHSDTYIGRGGYERKCRK